MAENGELLEKAREIIEHEEIPQSVSNKLIMAAIVEHARISKKNRETLFDKGGIVQKVKFWERVSWLFFTMLLAEAMALLFIK